MTERCSFCGGPIDPTTRACRACGRLHPSASGAAAPARPVSNALMKHCPTCGQALPMEARFCAHCGRSFSAELARLSATPEGPAQASSSPFAPAGPQSSTPSVPGAYAGPQSGATWGPPGGVQGGSQGWPGGTLAQGAGQAAGKSAAGKLLGTLTGKIIVAVLAVVVVAGGAAAVIVARGSLHLGGTGAGSQPVGTVTEFTIPTAGSSPFAIIAGHDGNLWFTETQGGKIGRITTGGQITEFPGADKPFGIAAGPDGNLWFAGGTNIERITPDGKITPFLTPSGQIPTPKDVGL